MLSIFVNSTLGNGLYMDELIEVLFERFISHPNKYKKEIIYRSLLIVSRLKYENLEKWKKWSLVFDKYVKEA